MVNSIPSLVNISDKDRQQAHIQQVQQHQQLILQHQSLTVLNHQAAAAAAAAAAQILPSNKYTSSNILPQIHSQVLPASLTTNCLLPGAINSALPHATSVHSISNSQLSHSVPSLSSANLSTYLPNTNLSGLLYPLTANATLSAAVSTGPPTNNGQLNLSLPLSQIAGGITGSGLSGLPLSIGSTLHAASHDQLAAVAAALLGGSGTGGIGSSSTNLHLCNGNMNNTVPNINSGPHSYPITPHTSLADAVNILEYNSTSNAQDCGSGSFHCMLTSLNLKLMINICFIEGHLNYGPFKPHHLRLLECIPTLDSNNSLFVLPLFCTKLCPELVLLSILLLLLLLHIPGYLLG
ncbi:hypothetical protein KSF78_0003263 [Schistosoma japonicum]|nr:hypothetical protein KSF78_0003263 [Schistosoma japonicum]